MNKIMLQVLLTTLLITLSLSETQTGYVDMNRQLGDINYLNGQSNIICFTKIFERQFPSPPKITTSLAEFKTEESTNFHVFIKVRKIQLSTIEARFMIFARKDVSIWSKIVFSYLATDHSQITPSIGHFNTEDLSGCGNLEAQNFEIKSPALTKDSRIAAYINGFDVSTNQIEGGKALLDIAVKVTERNENSFTLQVSRKSSLEIYSVSVGYIIVNTLSKIKPLEVYQSSEILTDIPIKQPYIYLKNHELRLKNANVFLGFESFTFEFNTKKPDQLKSIALTMNEQFLVIGSLDSSTLKKATVSYLTLQQVFECKLGEVIYFDSVKKQLQCKKCDAKSNKIPNKDQDLCICADKYYEIAGICYLEPSKGKYNKNQGTFICQEGYTMIFQKKQIQFKCEKAPQYKMYDSESEKWVCIDTYYTEGENCYPIPKDASFDAKLQKVVCKNAKILVEGQCLESGENQQYNFGEKRFVCKKEYFRVSKACIKPITNALYDAKVQQFVCLQGYYFSQPGKCSAIPLTMVYDTKEKKLVCKENHYSIKDQGCVKLPQGTVYIASLQKFICKSGTYLTKDVCRKPIENEEYSAQLKELVCVDGTYRIGELCLKPKTNTHYSKISLKFECNEGYYEINKQCSAIPKNMEYSIQLKKFVCLKGFQDLDKKCVQIPENKIWSLSTLKFICKQGFYETADSKCAKPKINEIYVLSSKTFGCNEKQGYYRIKGQCLTLPLNSEYSRESQDYKCLERYYKNNNKCESCNKNCLVCKDASSCTNCRDGFKQQLGFCTEICGDGIKFEADCDDNNTKDNDGCSSKCQIESGYFCDGGSPQSVDKCAMLLTETVQADQTPQGPLDIRLVGMSHMYAKIILNVKISYVPINLLLNSNKLSKLFRVLTNAKIPLKVTSMYIDTSEYTFVVLYDFNRFEPIPEYLTRIEINPEIKQEYYKDIQVNPLFIKVNPALMARSDTGSERDII